MPFAVTFAGLWRIDQNCLDFGGVLIDWNGCITSESICQRLEEVVEASLVVSLKDFLVLGIQVKSYRVALQPRCALP